MMKEKFKNWLINESKKSANKLTTITILKK
jgi:hypothetical protein